MTPGLTAAVLAAAGLLTCWAAVEAALGRVPRQRLLQGLLALQALLLGQLAYVLLRLAAGERPAEAGAFAGYLVLSLLLLPGGFALSIDERSRYGTLVLAVTCATVAVVEARMAATWS